MSTAMTFGQKQFIPTPPEKGSFPLDHDGICKKTMVKYMTCLFNNESNNTMCRTEAKEYLACRMEHNLMAKEEWSKLGYKDAELKNET
ncbi:cytochrome c oxidase assembly protein COX19 [Aricia agestis]|uniref:cytochrome c oxidase assembly protein COX19 n=1 Tax=Aricia agestis TaxID=91739 RepID=UPI001C203101|nr:cytochrome c oxidase assembly protein COX19 [Aricia agestis]